MSATAGLLVVQHERGAPPGLVGDWLEAAGLTLDVIHPYAGDPVPADASGHAGVMVLGGGMGATDDDDAPWLPAVRALLARCVDDGTPVWGICLGGQLLAAATGGRVALGRRAELGVCDVAVAPAGEHDALFGTLAPVVAVTQFHRDGIDVLPPDAVLLASSVDYPHQGFRLGECAWGVQFHPEVDAELVAPWLDDEGDIVESSGLDAAEVVEGIAAAADELERTWRPFAQAFAGVVLARAAR